MIHNPNAAIDYMDLSIINHRDDTIPRLYYIGSEYELRKARDLYYLPRIKEEDVEKDKTVTSGTSVLNKRKLPPEESLGYEASRKMFTSILYRIFNRVGPFTIVYESYNVNPVYRDSYYNFFAGQHFDVSRFAERCFFFKGNVLEYEDGYSKERRDKLEELLIGTLIIYPTEAQTIGRALFKPNYIIDSKYFAHIRLTEYSVTVLGVQLKLRAFPFQMQDKETMRCAEVTLLNILDYYGNTYTEYKTLLPGEIVQLEKQYTMERTLPSRGTNYAIMSKILTRCGFAPRLYNKEAIEKPEDNDAEWKSHGMHRLLHYYVESGFPVAVNVENGNPPGHSLICIGYQEKLETDVIGNVLEDSNGIVLYNAADFYQNYVVIDDNQMPYSIRKYTNLSVRSGYHVQNILVPLYKRMYLEAADAYDMAKLILMDKSFGIEVRNASFMKSNKELVIRLFLASSRTYKKFRIEKSQAQEPMYRKLIREIPLPRFVWVAELFEKEQFLKQDGLAFAEYVLDATASIRNDTKSIIMLNYPDSVCVRWPDWPIYALDDQFYNKDKSLNIHLAPYPRFTGNLEKF